MFVKLALVTRPVVEKLAPFVGSHEIVAEPDTDPLSASRFPLVNARVEGAVFEDIPIKQRSSQVRGVILVELQSDSRLARRGMRPGDIVIGANRSRVGNLEEFREVVSGINGTLYLEVLRKGRDYVVRVD